MHRPALFAFLCSSVLVALPAGADPTPALDRQAAAIVAGLDAIPRRDLPRLDMRQIRRLDEARADRGQVSHFAAPIRVEVDPWRHGDWQRAGDDRARWRWRVRSAGALSLSLAFTRFHMPRGGRLSIYSADGELALGPFTSLDNETHGELWTPPLASDELVLEVVVPVARLEELELELGRVHHGYAGFGEAGPKSGDCNVDITCSEADGWRDPARSVALVTIAGVRFCTGFLVNNTALDGRPLFLTARHCGLNRRNAASLVVVWGYENGSCRRQGEASSATTTRRFQTGATFLASWERSDFALVELDDRPPASSGLHFAGWDRSSTEPRRSVAIHHPNTDVQRISFDVDPARRTAHLSDERDAHGDHLRIGDWEQGTTEGGSSGAPLFNQERRVVGLLHGGYAACGDDRADWFGSLSAAWEGGGRPDRRLSDWLDPIGSDALVLDGMDAASITPP